MAKKTRSKKRVQKHNKTKRVKKMKKMKRTIGSRREVMNGTVLKTTGGLMKKDLMYNKQRRIVSRKLHKQAKKQKHLKDYVTKPGEFGAFKKVGNKLVKVGKRRR